MRFACLLAAFWGTGFAVAGDPAEKKSREVVERGIRAFVAGMRSDDEATRIAAFDKYVFDQKVLEKLFGDDAKHLEPATKKGLPLLRANTAKFKAEFDVKGDIKSIELINERTDRLSEGHRKLFALIPKDIPVYRAIVESEKGSGGSGSYIVLDGNMRFVRGLEALPELLETLKKK